MALTITALHTSHPSHPSATERTISLADFTALLLANHGVSGFDWQSMTVRDADGTEGRCWFSWSADGRRYGTDFHMKTASGQVLHTIKMPGFWYSGTVRAA